MAKKPVRVIVKFEGDRPDEVIPIKPKTTAYEVVDFVEKRFPEHLYMVLQ